MALPDLEAWAIFAAVAEHRSFTGAAETLGLSKATVSKAVSRLEGRLGASLFHRSARRLALTETGESLLPRAAAMLAEAEAAEEAAREEASEPAGIVRIAAPMSFGMRALGPVLAEFLAAHPAITADVHLSDAQVDLVAGGYDIGIRIADLPDSAMMARRIGEVAALTVASPAYLDRMGRPRHPADLATHRVFTYTNLPGGTLRFTGPGGEHVAVRPAGPLRSNSGELFLPALCAGLGIAVLPDFIVADEIAAGRLEAVLPAWTRRIGMHLLTPSAGPRPRRVTLLLDHLADRLGRMCRAATRQES